MDFQMPVVIDDGIFDMIPEKTKHVKFLVFWLSKNDYSKAIVTKKNWKKFNDYWDVEISEGECKDFFFQYVRGIVRPYRKEGFESEPEETDDILQIKKMINRDYDIVEYLIVKSPDLYRGKGIKIADDRIVDLVGFYRHVVSRPQYSKIVNDFEEIIKCED